MRKKEKSVNWKELVLSIGLQWLIAPGGLLVGFVLRCFAHSGIILNISTILIAITTIATLLYVFLIYRLYRLFPKNKDTSDNSIHNHQYENNHKKKEIEPSYSYYYQISCIEFKNRNDIEYYIKDEFKLLNSNLGRISIPLSWTGSEFKSCRLVEGQENKYELKENNGVANWVFIEFKEKNSLDIGMTMK